jgi:hypothetical protein
MHCLVAVAFSPVRRARERRFSPAIGWDYAGAPHLSGWNHNETFLLEYI